MPGPPLVNRSKRRTSGCRAFPCAVEAYAQAGPSVARRPSLAGGPFKSGRWGLSAWTLIPLRGKYNRIARTGSPPAPSGGLARYSSTMDETVVTYLEVVSSEPR